METRTTNLAIECGKLGYDWEDVLEQAAKERDRMIALGLNPDTKINMEKHEDDDDEKNSEIDQTDARTDPGDAGRRRK
jgi:capsid protein